MIKHVLDLIPYSSFCLNKCWAFSAFFSIYLNLGSKDLIYSFIFMLTWEKCADISLRVVFSLFYSKCANLSLHSNSLVFCLSYLSIFSSFSSQFFCTFSTSALFWVISWESQVVYWLIFFIFSPIVLKVLSNSHNFRLCSSTRTLTASIKGVNCALNA